MSGRRILVTGATGYVGGRLAPRLVDAGHTVRALARDPGRLRDAAWAGDVEIVKGDLEVPSDVRRAVEGIDVVYHLVPVLPQVLRERLIVVLNGQEFGVWVVTGRTEWLGPRY